MSHSLFQAFANIPAAQDLAGRVERGMVCPCAGVSPAGQAFFAAWLRWRFPRRTILVVTEGLKAQEVFQQDVETWTRLSLRPAAGQDSHAAPGSPPASAEPSVLFHPAWEVLPHEAKLPHADVISDRLRTLVALRARLETGAGGAPVPMVVTSVTALLQRTFPVGEISARTRMIGRADRVDPLDLVEWLEEQGYEPEAKVTSKGELSLRGGILDLYPPISPWPLRIEFFGDEVESIREFDPVSQISRQEVAGLTVPPAGELAFLRRRVQESRDARAHGDGLATLTDYLPPDTIVVACEPEALAAHAEAYAGAIPRNDPLLADWDEMQDQWRQRGLSVVELSAGEAFPSDAGDSPADGGGTGCGPSSLSLPHLDAFRPLAERMTDPHVGEVQRRSFFQQLHRWIRQGLAVHVFCNNEGERQRFAEIWDDYGLGRLSAAGDSAAETGPIMGLGTLSRGFLCEPARLVVVTDAEIFGRYKVQRPRRLKSPHAAATRSAFDIDFTELSEGDYVVHVQHGIGRYLGLKVIPAGAGGRGADGRTSASGASTGGPECLVIEYAAVDSDQPAPKLYVPVNEAHLVSKYVGAGRARPALNTLGGVRWTKTKAQAEEAVRDLAAELLSIQAARESQSGHAFPSDTPWQREFEGAFLYEETPDQLRAIDASKRDMESARPMDRLICGDVGFGKTEVAIRAAFKAVMSGKQVAVLVPTTVLAQQHFNNFRERMADYPIRIEQLSRFRTRAEQRAILEQMAAGSIDIIIGTHRLIQSDVVFKDLGLVVIDEEQRFGVLHKERFKLLRRLVDVLTLSATPIPRTLYLALTGARDMSTIETPPQDRLPVETIVAQYDERLIRDAIQRELNRDGQVYYLHNRVGDIENVALRIKGLVPQARVIVGHGQMESDELEKVMTTFIDGGADVLVSTTIIESGIDIPNANTIIIERADRFGLSDLYQLRGRVGRYTHQAYAYILLPRHASLLSDVRKRITAIKQYSTLGSGFKIAMRDLEIRGAGNLLGPQQSGHITAVGFELYCQLLKQSVSALKGEKIKPRVEAQVRIDFLALHPGEEAVEPGPGRDRRPASREDGVQVPREVASRVGGPTRDEMDAGADDIVGRAPAYIPVQYVGEAHQRIEVYRKLAQVTDKASLENLRGELRDRFGKLPVPVELLLQLAEIRWLASEREVTAIETRGARLMLTRRGDFVMVGGRFPRLTKREAKGRLNEIKKVLLAL